MISAGIKQKLIIAGWLPSMRGNYDLMRKHYRKEKKLVFLVSGELWITDENGKRLINSIGDCYYVQTLKDIYELLKENGIVDKDIERHVNLNID